MPKIKFVKLTCHTTTDMSESDDTAFDTTIEDEPYLLVNHKRVWGVSRIKADETIDLSDVEPVSFSDQVVVELWDRDAGYSPADDRLGRLSVQAGHAGSGELSHEFRRSKARYTLTYLVE